MEKIRPNIGSGTILGVPRPPGAIPGRNGEKMFSISPPGSGPMYALVYPAKLPPPRSAPPGPARPGVQGGPGAGMPPRSSWVNYSRHGPRPGRRYRKKIPRFGLEWPPAASGPPESCPNRYLDDFFPSFIKFHCNRTIFEVFFRSGGRGAHVCYSLPRIG